MRAINLVVIHCSATPADMDVGAAEIRDWHVNDNGWRDIGYHWVIRRNGVVERGRPEEQEGAHTVGHNRASIGVCMVGGVRREGGLLVAEDNFTVLQWESLRSLVRDLLRRFPGAEVLGHRDFDRHKACPSFSVRDWLAREGISLHAWGGRTLAVGVPVSPARVKGS